MYDSYLLEEISNISDLPVTSVTDRINKAHLNEQTKVKD